MISRRALFYAFATVTGAGSVGMRASAQTPPVGLSDLERIPASSTPLWVEGQGWFHAASPDSEPDGLVVIAGADNTRWQRSGYNGTVRPQWFARADDGGDDALAIQRACDYAARNRVEQIDLGNRIYKCRSRIEIDPTRTAIVGAGAVLDFTSFPEPKAQPPVITLDQLVVAGNWTRNGSALVHPDGAETSMKAFFAAPGDGRYRVDIAFSQLDGKNSIPFCRVILTTPDGTEIFRAVLSAPGDYAFEFKGPQPVVRLTLEANANVRLEALTVAWHGRRECILLCSTADSGRHGHKWIEGVEITGPGGDTTLEAVRFETMTKTFSSRIEMRNVNIAGFGAGLAFSHRSYLSRFYGVRCVCTTAVEFIGGSLDAGENISFYGCTLGGGGVGIRNGGAEMFLTGTSINFVRQVYVGRGTLTMVGCHLETQRPSESDLPLFDISNGHAHLSGGVLMVSGRDFDKGNRCDHIFELRSKRATATLVDVSAYNLRTQTGALAGGPGRLDVQGMRGRRPRHVAPIVQYGPDRNLLGPRPYDIRVSKSSDGELTELGSAADEEIFIDPGPRYLWILGMARPGMEIGASLEMRSGAQISIPAWIVAVRGRARTSLSDQWDLPLTGEWALFQNTTANAHPSSPFGGRVPEGYDQVALVLDLSAAQAAVGMRSLFLGAG